MKTRTDEQRAEMSKRMKGVRNAKGSKRTAEQRARQSDRMKGVKLSDETRGRMSKAASGRAVPDETKEKIAASVSESIAKKHYEMIDFMQNAEIEKSPFA